MTLFVFLLVLLVVALWVGFGGDGDSDVRTMGSLDGAEVHASQGPVDGLALASPSKERAPLRAREQVEVAGSAEEGTGDRELETLTLRGRIVVHEQDGTMNEVADGAVQFESHEAFGWEPLRVSVQAGRFEVSFEEQPEGTFVREGKSFAKEFSEHLFRVCLLDLEGGLATPVDEGGSFGFMDGSIVIEARRVPSVLIYATDAETGETLNSIRLVELSNRWRLEDQHPGDMDEMNELAWNEPSPIRWEPSKWWIEDREDTPVGYLLVSSKGYAWLPFSHALLGGGERHVSLKKGGDLNVFLSQIPDEPELFLRLRLNEWDSPAATFAVSGLGPYRFDGLASGPVEVCLESGESEYAAIGLGAANVQIEAGKVQEVLVMVKERPKVEKVPLSGKIGVPLAWGVDPFYFDDKTLEEVRGPARDTKRLSSAKLKPVEGEEGAYHFDFGLVVKGRHLLGIESMQAFVQLDLGPAGNEQVLFMVPEPVELKVLVWNETTGVVADIDHLSWYQERLPGIRGGSSESVERLAGEDFYRILTPRGKVHLNISDDAYSAVLEVVSVSQDMEFKLSVRLAARAVIRLSDGETPVPWPVEYDFFPYFLDGTPVSTGFRHRGGVLELSASEPGRYRLPGPKVPGFKPVDPIEWQMEEGKTTEIEVRLVREYQ